MHYAAFNRRENMVQFILSRGFDVDCTDSFNSSALHEVAQCSRDDPEPCELLLKHGASVNRRATGEHLRNGTPLTLAARRGAKRIVQVLLKYGANPSDRYYDHDKGLLEMATFHHCDDISKLLIRKMVEMEFLNLSINNDDLQLIENNCTYKR